MNTEIIPEDDKLVVYSKQSGLETSAASSLAEAFRPIYIKARAAIGDAAGVAESVKDATCVKEIRKSRACRLALRAIRIESESTRKKQKEHALLYGRAVDGFHNILLAELSPVESALQDAEDVAERAEAARMSALKASRESEMRPFTDAPITANLAELSEEAFAQVLSDAKLLKQAKIDAALKAAEEARAKAEADRIERERIAEENARLKAEAVEREAKAKAEREAAEKLRAKERAAAEALAKAAAEKARKEREAIESKARAERAAAEAKHREEQQRLQGIAEENRKKLALIEASAKAARDAEAKRLEEAAAAAKKAAAAPDNAKAKAFADSLRKLALPAFSTDAFDLLPYKIECVAKWIESRIEIKP